MNKTTEQRCAIHDEELQELWANDPPICESCYQAAFHYHDEGLEDEHDPEES